MVTRDGTTGRTKDLLMIDYRRLTLLALVLVAVVPPLKLAFLPVPHLLTALVLGPDPLMLALVLVPDPLILALVPVRTSIVWPEGRLHDGHALFC